MTEPQSAAGRAVTGQMSDAMRSAIIDEIRDATLDHLGREDAARVLRLASRAASAVFSIVGLWDQLNDFYDMALAGYEAFTIPRRKVERVAAAHAFGWWVFQNPGTLPPKTMPIGFQREMQESDESDAHIALVDGNPNFSSDGGLSTARWQGIWQWSVGRTISGLETELLAKAASGELARILRDASGGHALAEGQSDSDIATQYRLMKIAPPFRQTPELAARSHLLGSLQVEDSHHARSAIMRFYARYPYRPGA